jgi:phage shock protein PspC (stress-responsive transcriptional regulator)
MCGRVPATHSRAMETTTNTAQDTTNPTQDQPTDPQGQAYGRSPALVRPVRGRMLAGVAAGAADYLGVDPTIVRIALAVLAVAGPGIPLYLAGWLLIPDEGARQSVAADVIDSISYREK